MTRGTRTRLILFAILSAIGIVYVGASYLGIVNAVLGRNKTVYVDLPNSGGTYVGSEVDYRGVKIGKVSDMILTRQGVRLKLTLDPGAKVPESSPLLVSNLTAIGEQYVNFIPGSANPPYAGDGYVFTGTAADLPESTDNLLLTLNSFVNSVDPKDLTTAVGELGTMFKDNSDALGTIIDQGSKFLKTAQQHQAQTIQLLNSGEGVLNTQIAHGGDLRTFTSGLATLTAALKNSDGSLRTIINTGALREADGLVNDLRATLPGFLKSAVPVTQIVHDRRNALEQTLIVFPPVVSSGFTATDPNNDGYGHLNMQFDYSMSPCSGQGYLPKPWPSSQDLRDLPLYNARCDDPKAQPSYHGADGILQRGSNMVPPVGSSGAAYRTSTGTTSSASAATSTGPSFADPQSVMGTSAWVWMLVGPVSAP